MIIIEQLKKVKDTRSHINQVSCYGSGFLGHNRHDLWSK